MKFLRINPTLDPKIIGGSTASQIKDDGQSFELINQGLSTHTADWLKQIARIPFELRYDAKVTDVITGIMFSHGLWFVNLRFLSLFDRHKVAKHNTEPAFLRYRNKYLEDYFLFQFALGIEDQVVDFAGSEYILEYQFPERQIHCALKIHSYKDYEYHQDLIRNEYGKLIVTDLKFREELEYDFFYIKSFGLGFLASERFATSIDNLNITGIRVSEIERGPYHRLIGPNRIVAK